MAADQHATATPAPNLLGFWLFSSCNSPPRYHRLRHSSGDLIVVVAAALAYEFGLGHRFDADHISAIEGTARCRRQKGKRPMGGVLLQGISTRRIGSIGRHLPTFCPAPDHV